MPRQILPHLEALSQQIHGVLSHYRRMLDDEFLFGAGAQMPQVACTILIGRYAMERYAADIDGTTLAERVRAVYERDDERVLLPHPSPRNQRWLRRHPWFVEEVLPELRGRIAEVLG